MSRYLPPPGQVASHVTLQDVTSVLLVPTYQRPACPAALHRTHSQLMMVFLTVACCGGLAPHTQPLLAARWLLAERGRSHQGASGRSALAGEGDGCKQKSSGRLLADTGQLRLNHLPKGAQQPTPEVPAGRARTLADAAVTAIAVLPVPASLLETRLCPLPVPREKPAST